MVKNTQFLILYKIFFALLGFSAIVTEIATIVERGNFNPINFFSFFTIQTNSLVFITLLISGIAVAAGKNKKLDVLRSATTVYALIVGIGFSLLLSGLEGIRLTAVPWDNTVLHYIIPVAMLGDFLINRPTRHIPFKKGLMWLLFPIVYVAYSLIRGAITGWYPYPFLNPAVQSYASIFVTFLELLVLSLVLIWLACKLSGKKS